MKKFYITTSIPYTNSAPHIGFAMEIIQADVIARYNRSLKKDVFFLTGTDEHGIKTLRAAKEAGKDALEFANETSEKYRKLAKILNISNSDFIRTTDEKRHLPAVYKLWEEYNKKGDIYKKKYSGFYCAGCETFKTQKELVDGKCAIHNKPVEKIEEENYFFKLSKYLPEIKKLIEKDKIRIIPESRKNEVLKMIDSGLEDVSFTRDKDKYWGWPVPNDESQVFYVWQDALPNYISAIGYPDKEFAKYWPADIHFIGKDIIKFHAIYWPAMLLSAGLKLPSNIFVHGFILSNGQKMSKSLGNVIDPFGLVEKYGSIISPQAATDSVRYYLLREIPSTEDGDFTLEKFVGRYNSDLAGGIGNLVARVTTLARNLKFEIRNLKLISNPQLKTQIKETEKKYKIAIEDFKFNEALKAVWELISFCDRYINEEKPWEGGKDQVVSDLLLTLKEISNLLVPFLPETSEKILKSIESSTKPESLFPRIDIK